MRKLTTALFISAAMLFGASTAEAHPGHHHNSLKAHVAYTMSCYDAWKYSGHTDRVYSYHCHGEGGAWLRIHIYGWSGLWHGLTVHHYHSSIWESHQVYSDHAHSYYH